MATIKITIAGTPAHATCTRPLPCTAGCRNDAATVYHAIECNLAGKTLNFQKDERKKWLKAGRRYDSYERFADSTNCTMPNLP
jgi:hypothetical protein